MIDKKVQWMSYVCGRSKFAMDLKERGGQEARKALNEEEQRVWTMSCACVCVSEPPQCVAVRVV